MTRDTLRGLAIAAVCGAAAGLAIAAPRSDGAQAIEPAADRDQRIAAQVRGWLIRQGFPVYQQPVWVVNEIPSPWLPTSEVAAVATTAGPVLRQDITVGPDSRQMVAETLIHEYLHSMRDTREYATLTPGERIIEEGAVTAVTEDLAVRFECAVWRECGPAGTMVFAESSGDYAAWAAMVRGVSGRAVGARWISPRARAWRYRLVKADRAARAVMWERATGGPR